MLRHRLGPTGLLLAGLLAATPALADQTHTLTEGWQARWSDPPALADGRPGWLAPDFEKSFTPVPAGGEPADRADGDLLWLSLPIPSVELSDPTLHLEIVNGGAIEAWFAGQRVYESGEIRPGARAHVEHVPAHSIRIPRRALGERVLLRIQRSDNGGAPKEVQLVERGELILSLMRKNLIPLSIGGLGIIAGLSALAGWLRFRSQRSLLALAGFSAGIGLVFVFRSEVPPLLIGQSSAYGFGIGLSTIVAIPSLGLFFTMGVAREQRRWLDIMIRLVAATGAAVTLALLLGADLVKSLVPWMFLAMISVAATGAMSIKEALQGSFEARAFALGLLALAATAIADLLTVIGVLDLPGLPPLGLLTLLSSLIVIVATRVTALLEETARHAQLLQSREGEVSRLGKELSGGANRLAEAVAMLRQAGEIQSEVLRQQNAAISETQATAAQIGQTSALTSVKVSAVRQAAERAEQSGRSGGTALSQTLSGLEAVHAEVEGMSERIAGVGERTRQIDGIVATVKDIADQSHLLALNARIEAARAGEHGLGFTVVANELGQLAAQSLEATTQIRLALRGIDEAIRSAVQSSAGGSARVEEIVTQTRSSAERLREVAGIATETGESAREIAAAVSQQNAGVKQMLEAIRILSDGSFKADGALSASDRAAANVHQVASELLAATARRVV